MQISSTTAISWVMTTTVMPSRRLMSFTRRRMSRVVLGSRAEVASSHSRMLGSQARARAMATRCFCPPDSWAGYASALSGRPTTSSSSRARRSASAFFTPAISMGKQMFFKQVRCISRLNCWKIMLMDRRRTMSSLGPMAHRSAPSMMTCPAVGRSSRLMHRTSVDLPAPLMPTMP